MPAAQPCLKRRRPLHGLALNGVGCRATLPLVGLDRLELSTSPLSGVRSNHLSYRPEERTASGKRTLQSPSPAPSNPPDAQSASPQTRAAGNPARRPQGQPRLYRLRYSAGDAAREDTYMTRKRNEDGDIRTPKPACHYLSCEHKRMSFRHVSKHAIQTAPEPSLVPILV